MIDATYAAARLLRALPRQSINRAAGRLSEAPLHPSLMRVFVGLYSRAYGVDMDEAEPSGGRYSSVDAFFTRALRTGVRPIWPDEAVLVCPADGHLEDMGAVGEGARISVKGQTYDIADLLGDASDAERYVGGRYAVIYLSPRDYHRVHAPATGQVPVVRSLPGDFFPVNSIGRRHVPSLLAKNRRVAIPLDSEWFGRVTVVMVGALIVGRITVSALEERDVPVGVHVVDPPQQTKRGDELGVFHLGSTVVIFVEKGAKRPRNLGLPPRASSRVRVGEPLVWGEQ